jgi:hypothetical protein
MAEFVNVGLVYTRIRTDLNPVTAKIVERVYIGPDDENAEAAFAACRILRDSFQISGVSGPNHCSISAILPFKLPIGQIP